MRILRTALLPAAAVAALVLATPFARADFIVLPGSATTTEGNSSSSNPFQGLTQRYQQVFGASDFTGQGASGTLTISQITFRDDAAGASFIIQYPDITFTLSTTSKAPDGLDTIFANNVGSDVTTVFNNALTFNHTQTGTNPQPFDLVVNLTTPFTYKTGNGNLLLQVDVNQVANNISGAAGAFDAQNTAGDSVSRVVGPAGGSVGSADTLGLVTRFTFSNASVPEPGSLALLSLSAVAGALYSGRHWWPFAKRGTGVANGQKVKS